MQCTSLPVKHQMTRSNFSSRSTTLMVSGLSHVDTSNMTNDKCVSFVFCYQTVRYFSPFFSSEVKDQFMKF